MADYQYVLLTGLIVPDTGTILTDVQNEYKGAFGQDLIVTPDTPQGVLITAETLARTAVVNNNVAVANQINPNVAEGIFLDAIGALTGSVRNPNVYTTVSCDLAGVAGTVISAGVQAKVSSSPEIFASADLVTLDGSGNATVDFIAVNPGPIDVLATTLTQIVTSVLGWDTITNPDVGIPGQLQQSDISFRNLRRLTLALQGMALSEAIISALNATAGVTSVGYHENYTDGTIVFEGVTLIPHSIYACVDGGTSADVAQVLLNKKSGGCAYNGDVTVNVTDQFSGQVYPVKFSRPEVIDILVQVTAKAGTSVQNPVQSIKNSILAYANGEIDNEPGLVIGQDVSCFELSGAVAAQNPSIFVKDVQTSLISPVSYSHDEIEILISQRARILESSISVILV